MPIPQNEYNYYISQTIRTEKELLSVQLRCWGREGDGFTEARTPTGGVVFGHSFKISPTGTFRMQSLESGLNGQKIIFFLSNSFSPSNKKMLRKLY